MSSQNNKRTMLITLMAVLFAAIGYIVFIKNTPDEKPTPTEATDISASIPTVSSGSDQQLLDDHKKAADGIPAENIETILLKDLLVSDDLGSALTRASLTLGNKDVQLISIYMQIRNACEMLKSDAQISAVIEMKDQRKEKAQKELSNRCKTFDERKLEIAKETGLDLINTSLKKGNDVAAQEALNNIKSYKNAAEDILAGEILMSTNKFPVNEVFGTTLNPTYQELSDAWKFAAMQRECNTFSACGRSSFSTLSYCAQYGCNTGATFDSALRETLSQRQYQMISSINAWYARKR
jgi:hypothetical protein